MAISAAKYCVALIGLLAFAAPGFANAPASSPVPQLRPGAVVVVAPRARAPVTGRSAAPARSIIPRARPGARIARGTPLPARDTGGQRRTTLPPVSSNVARLCRDRAILGERLAPIQGELAGCAITAPVRVHAVEGVRMSPPAIMDCDTATALKTWINDGVKPGVRRLGGGVAGLRVAAGYACRPRNGQPGQPISEHGKGSAVDISALVLKNGVTIEVEDGWRDPVAGKVLRGVHGAACGPFQTVLGPDSDRFHRDHLHLDTADRRGRAVCR